MTVKIDPPTIQKTYQTHCFGHDSVLQASGAMKTCILKHWQQRVRCRIYKAEFQMTVRKCLQRGRRRHNWKNNNPLWFCMLVQTTVFYSYKQCWMLINNAVLHTIQSWIISSTKPINNNDTQIYSTSFAFLFAFLCYFAGSFSATHLIQRRMGWRLYLMKWHRSWQENGQINFPGNFVWKFEASCLKNA